MRHLKKLLLKKKCEDRLVTELIKDKFTILDLETGQLSPYYSYNCDELIPKELNNNEKVNEIARMISGEKVTPEALDFAKNLLKS